ncbi:MAG TPA: sialidase family protein, partial [Mycobacterium sp.]|nr:sialidase family protein [Mycobacterium sp.]
MRVRFVMTMLGVAAAVLALGVAPASALTPDTRVSVGSPSTPFSQNKQNEPALAVDAHQPNVMVAGANDEIDMEACNAGTDNTCPFTPGVGTSGVYFSFDSGTTWTQPTYTGLTARNCLGAVGANDPNCVPQVGPIGTLPKYYESGLVSDGDPAVAFGPRPGADGTFSWANGSRLYYANLAANLGATRSEQTFKGFEAIAVSRTDNVQAAAAGSNSAWQAPVVISKQSSTTFSDKEQIWSDNASSSPFFGTTYVCWAAFRGQEKGNAAPAPLQVAVSHDGGDTWKQHQVSAAANNSERNPTDGCTIRTDSRGNAYVFGIGTVSSRGHQAFELMSVSGNGGSTWSRPRPVVGPVTQPGVLDPVQGRPVIDGVAGARSDLAPAPSVDIANGAPTGADATDRIVMSYVSGTISAPHVYFAESTNRGASWPNPRAVESPGDRGFYAAPAISPDGTDVYVVYNAFTTPYRNNTTDPRTLVGVVLHADSSADPGTPTGAFAELHRGAPGDPRGSSANALTDEFLGDYVYAVATRTYGAGVWNDVRNA